ncbi:hypothetical protein F3Y22_tig00020138pilonHSYRG00087 [Hibiscus syriacus]|uniref:RNase H type-1 domain-containing protein n=1 Tax=Hibiscus syriacus TaxID=106335 RepID=A0A6A3BU75_HIBSY|nr:hypothetical protein F3Y22_tig00020138pilonHSYRG00087 [Hibiscus syriacus]
MVVVFPLHVFSARLFKSNSNVPTTQFSNLQKRHLIVNTSCKLCDFAPESTEHIIKECSFFNQEEVKVLIVSIWSIWNFQNRIVHDGLPLNFDTIRVSNRGRGRIFGYFGFTVIAAVAGAIAVVADAIAAVADTIVKQIKHYMQETGKINHQSCLRNDRNARWTPPREDLVKINFDGSFDMNTNSSVSGILVRDNQGLIMASSTIPNRFIMSAEMAEARTCEQSVKLASELGFRKIIVEGDAMVVINKISKASEDRSNITRWCSLHRRWFFDLRSCNSRP